jgi:2'-5' RNA ligase
MPFEWEKEEKLVTTLKTFSFHPMEIELKDYGCFQSRVIFIDVAKNKALEEMQSRLVTFCKQELKLFNADYQAQPFHPHVTIAFRDLKKPMFDKAWNEFRDKKYHATFVCDHLSLMKHDGKFWREFS